ncbi:HAMP domain-containing sensor histidine kinase [Catenulispora rubra]|uniref:HAMP domain-containing sensor histidine kinase n=1 Tax=Catenulispora rubra TaxID=280293 RepID=UPI0018928673|nr:HAMP domain-containing sensor histidine kinase [Catenulispora rubra]
MNLRTRVAIGGGVTVVAAVALVGAIEYPAIGAGLRSNADADLVATAAGAPSTYGKLLAVANAKERFGIGGVNTSSKIEVGKGFMELVNTLLPVVAGKGTPVDERDKSVAAGNTPAYFTDVRNQGVLYRLYTAELPGHPGVLVRAATPESDPTGTLNRLTWLLVLLIPAAGLLAAVGARLLAARVLSPVARLTAAAEHIAATGDLSAPIAVAGRDGDEVARLGVAFNAMTAALDGSVGAQRRLVADASHELRTPLTSLVTNLELLAERPDDPQAPALIGEALYQALALAELTSDLVDLARFGEVPARSEVVRLDLLCADLAARRGAEVDAGNVAVVVRGDPAALERAVGNLVDNALKFGTRAVVTVRMSAGAAGLAASAASAASAAWVVVEVADDGPGIPEADVPYVFDRFHRSPDARALPGSGLGLAIAKQVAEAHGGRIEAVPRPVGALLRITLPVAAAP